MTQLTFIVVGTQKEDYFRTATAEYIKRLGAFCRAETVELREERIADENDPRAVAAALEAEGQKILARLAPDTSLFALCVEGEEMDSPTLAKRIGEKIDRGGRIAVAIGSSHGLSPAVKARADVRLSLSRLTFPHQMARLIAAEAFYRGFCILAGKNYHK